MKKLIKISMLFLLGIVLTTACKKETIYNGSSIIPSTFLGRETVIQEELKLKSKNVTFSVWDHGQIDGDIVSVYVNGKRVLNEFTLTGDKHNFNVTLDYKGYNYVLLYAHNEGSISPNTCSLSINDGTSTQDLSIESDLLTNGASDLIVQ